MPIKIDQDVHDFLTKYNFRQAGSCMCGGVFNAKYKYMNYTIYIQPKRKMFKVKENLSTIKEFTPLHELKNIFSNTIPIPA